jgi:hypothetical protein
MTAQPLTETPEPDTTTTRTVLVIDRSLPKGLAANAAALLALTLGVHRPTLVGPDFDDAAGRSHLGLFPTGLPVLGAEAGELPALREAARERGLLVVDMPAPGQRTTDYDEFRAAVASDEDLAYLGILVCGPPQPVRAVTGQLGLLR